MYYCTINIYLFICLAGVIERYDVKLNKDCIIEL